MLSKYETIETIIRLYDELAETKARLADARRGTQLVVTGCKDLSEIELGILRVGRRKVFEDCTYSWACVKAWREKGASDIKVTPLERFKEKMFQMAPDFMSKDEFMTYFADEFEARYEQESQKAIDDFRRWEADDEQRQR